MVLLNEANKLIHLSEETKKRISEKLKGRNLSKERRDKISKSLIGNQRRKGIKAKPEEVAQRVRLITKYKECLGECGWNSELGEPHLCHCGCGEPTGKYQGKGKFPKYVSTHWINQHYSKKYHCMNCRDQNYLVECKCLEHDIIVLRSKNNHITRYAKNHNRRGVGNLRNKNITEAQLKQFFFNRKFGRLAYPEDLPSVYPKPKICQSDNCNRPAKFLCIVDHDQDKINRRDPSVFKWLCKPHWFTNKDS